jgi:hypothetical protein
MSDAKFLVNKAAIEIENQESVEFCSYIDKVAHCIALHGKFEDAYGHYRRITPIKVRTLIRRLRSLGFKVSFTIRTGKSFEAKYVTEITVTV